MSELASELSESGRHRPADRQRSVLELASASCAYGTDQARVIALERVSVSVGAGEFVAVMGPSGSGKSTLLHLAGGLVLASDGVVRVEGADLAALSVAGRAALRRRQLGYVFQDFNLMPTLTAAENVALPLELDGVGRRAAHAAAMTALGVLKIVDLADRFPDQLSGGQQQRVAIARGIVGERRLLLADEPTGALDSHTSDAVLEVLRDRADAGIAVVMVTHEARFAGWADRVLFLRDGRVVDTAGVDSAEDLLERAR